MTTPTEGFARLRAAEADGTLAAFAEHHGLSLVVVFGSTARDEPAPRDLDVAVASRGSGVGPVAVVSTRSSAVSHSTSTRPVSTPANSCGPAGSGWVPSGCAGSIRR